jgi:hypothetical protein
MLTHEWDCMYRQWPVHELFVTYNRVRVCFKCYSISRYGVMLCKCVLIGDPPDRIRSHIGNVCITDNAIPRSSVFHYIPDDFPPCGDNNVCPRRGSYRSCRSVIKHLQCTNLVGNNCDICAHCIDINHCSELECDGVVTTRADPKNQSMMLCEDHCVFTCITCNLQKIDDIYRTQCRECDTATNSIVCCNAVHKPHSLTYPRRAITNPYCINCNCTPDGWRHIHDSYWRLIQTEYIWKLYKTVAASRSRRYLSFATALMLHLTWRGGVVACMWHAGESACVPYILSQRDCAASALMRVRWLPQPLRLMILGYI